jgi:hypothetical protein
VSRIPSLPLPILPLASGTDRQRFTTVRELRVDLVTGGLGLAFVLAGILLWSWPWTALCVLLAVAVSVAGLVHLYRTIDEPSPAISPERSRSLDQAVRLAGALAWVAIFVAALTRG